MLLTSTDIHFGRKDDRLESRKVKEKTLQVRMGYNSILREA